MEYFVPSAALLTHLCATGWANEDSDLYLSDDAVKCGIAHYASRVFLGCAVADSEAARFACKSQNGRYLRSRLATQAAVNDGTACECGDHSCS